MMTTAWSPTTPASFSLFFEDDTSVSPLFFTYTEWCIHTFLLTTTNPHPSIMGCSLYTPRVDEISITQDPQNPPKWSPTVAGVDRPVFLLQLPCSWGAVYTAQHWMGFVAYLEQRTAATARKIRRNTGARRKLKNGELVQSQEEEEKVE
ncbi:hypothetical protein HDU98_001102, partial [Podochytrium sp. JEL0797]